MKRIWRQACGVLALAVMGCSNPAEKVVKQYLSMQKCADRAQLVLNPEKYRPIMEAHYAQKASCAVPHGEIDVSSCKGIAVGARCTASTVLEQRKNATTFCLVASGKSEYRIDWACTVGWNETSAAKIRDQSLGSPVMFRAKLRLIDIDSDVFPKGDYFAVDVQPDGETQFLRGYVERDTSTARELQKLLDGGRARAATVLLTHPPRPKELYEVEILELVQPDWRELTPDESKNLEERTAIYTSLVPCCHAISTTRRYDDDPLVSATAAAKCRSWVREATEGKVSAQQALANARADLAKLTTAAPPHACVGAGK